MPRYLPIVAVTIISILSFMDIAREYSSGETPGHLIFELVIGITASILAFFLLRDLSSTKSELTITKDKLALKVAENDKWREGYNRLLKGVSNSIQEQFGQWSLTPAEKEVGLLLLKGLSYKEIADIRDTSEKTVRQQASVIYQKSGLPGRAELSAYFLEDFLVESNQASSVG